MPDKNGTSTFEDRIERTANTYSNFKTLAVAVATAIGVIFAAGVYYSQARQTLKELTNRLQQLETQVKSLETKQVSLIQQINLGFEHMLNIENAGPPFRNDEPFNNGGGNNPAYPPGRCAPGQVVVGVSPFKQDSGQRAIIMQCGAVPRITVSSD